MTRSGKKIGRQEVAIRCKNKTMRPEQSYGMVWYGVERWKAQLETRDGDKI